MFHQENLKDNLDELPSPPPKKKTHTHTYTHAHKKKVPAKNKR